MLVQPCCTRKAENECAHLRRSETFTASCKRSRQFSFVPASRRTSEWKRRVRWFQTPGRRCWGSWLVLMRLWLWVHLQPGLHFLPWWRKVNFIPAGECRTRHCEKMLANETLPRWVRYLVGGQVSEDSQRQAAAQSREDGPRLVRWDLGMSVDSFHRSRPASSGWRSMSSGLLEDAKHRVLNPPVWGFLLTARNGSRKPRPHWNLGDSLWCEWPIFTSVWFE